MRKITSRVVPAAKLSQADFDAWERLCASHDHLASPFYSPVYTRAVAQTRPYVYVCVLLHDSEPVGFFPFQFRNALHRAFGAAERVGEEMTDHFGLAAAREVRLDVQQLLRLSRLHHVNFTHLDEWQLSCGLPGESPRVGLLVQFESGASYWADLRKKNRKFVSETERKELQLEKEYGPIRFCWSAVDWEEPLRNLIHCKSQQYLRTGQDDWLAVRWKQKLLHLLAATRTPSCAGVMSTLYAGETWVASHFGLRCRNLLHYWFPVYNAALNRFGPGHLLRKWIIASASQHGVNIIDQGMGDAPDKRIYCTSTQNLYRGGWFNPGIPSLLCRAAYSVKWRWETRKLNA